MTQNALRLSMKKTRRHSITGRQEIRNSNALAQGIQGTY
jgi:hypothetical protein